MMDYRCAIATGSTVLVDGASELFTVTAFGERLSRISDFSGVEHLAKTSSLVAARFFGDPVMPLLEPTGEIMNAPGAPVHQIINGENLHALEMLQHTHAGAIDLIYVDPPYNTGNKGWKYNDRCVAEKDSYRHSKWLSFMEKRLLLAKKLLTPEGLILVAIDDHEQHRLRMLLDQIFGARNFMATFVWKSDGNVDNQAQIKGNHEYVHAYARDRPKVFVAGVKDPNISELSKLRLPEIRNSVVKNGPKNPISTIRIPSGFPAAFNTGKVSARQDRWPKFDDDVAVENGRTVNDTLATTGWASANLLRKFIEGGFVPIIDSKGQSTIFQLTHSGAIENVKERRSDQHHILTVLMNLGTVERAGNVLKSMGQVFPYPKPVELVQYLTSFARTDAVILDFFGGSGTTAEAVMRLNAEDGGTRQAILVTNNELAAADDKSLRTAGHKPGEAEYEALGVFHHVTRPRISTVITGIRDDGSKYSDGLAANAAFFDLRIDSKNLCL
jgi:adenine-specific DNA-methyltransferase